MKKKIIILSIVILLVIAVIVYLIFFQDKKIYLESKYYEEGIIKDIKLDELNEITNNNESFILYTYNNYCNLRIPCGDIFKESAVNNNITILSIKYEDFKNTKYHKIVKFAPSVLIVEKGKIISYLDSESDDDLIKYQDVKEFTNWLSKSVILKNK